ncbi:MAG: KPN_02809 family neutral zinc metallopeptidase [Beijerinckiaceae bacterium]
MRLDEIGQSDNVDDRRGSGGGGGMLRGGGLGFGGMVAAGLLAWFLGIDPRIVMGGAELISRGAGSMTQGSSTGKTGPVKDEIGRFASQVFEANEQVWKQIIPAQAGQLVRNAQGTAYQEPRLVLFTGATRSGCGGAQSAMGPFYCPTDRSVYLDLSFFQEMSTKMRAGGDFAYTYVIAHEIGHHIQNQLGILPQVQERQKQVSRREANALSVRVELMADCLAGVWGHHARNLIKLDESDVREAMNAAQAIGDDKLQKQSQGYVVPDSFTHGSSEQRTRWFMQGLRTGQMGQCNTFTARDI